MNARLVGENWFADFAYMRDHYDWGVLTYTFHPHVIGRGHRMMMLERLIEQARDAGASSSPWSRRSRNTAALSQGPQRAGALIR